MRKGLHEKELAWRTVGKNRGGNAEDFEKTEAGWNGAGATMRCHLVDDFSCYIGK